jgi:hypothetical protein
VAGFGTTGDFYGLGPTGHVGVGFCRYHERGRRKAKAEQYAINHMKSLQNLGKAERSQEVVRQMIYEDAVSANERNKIREDVALVRDTLEEFKRICDSGKLTARNKGEIVEASDVERIELALKIANTIKGIKFSEFQISQKDVLPYDELAVRIPLIIKITERAMERLMERLVAGEADALATTQKEWFEDFKGVWGNNIRTV